jgi:microcystin-dependent protein
MSKGFYTWSQTANSNASADNSINWAEGMAPSAINDSARAMMARTAEYRDDISGAIVTGGTSTAYTLSSYQGFDTLAHMDKQIIAFTPHVTNGDTVTLTTDTLGTKPLRPAPGVELISGTMVQGTPYTALYSNTDGAWYLHAFYSSPYNVPFLGGLDYWDTVTPNSSFIFPMGQAISRSIYSRAFARWGTTYGPGDGSTTFNVPPKAGRVSVMKEAVATLLTSTYFGGNSTVIGAVGGGESSTIVTPNLPPYTPTGTNSGGTNNIPTTPIGVSTTSNNVPVWQASAYGSAAILTEPTFTGAAQGGTSTPLRTTQPTIVTNYIIRIL